MGTIRALEREDLPAVAVILRRQFEGWARSEAFLESTLFDHPFAVGEVPSRVALTGDGQIGGFIGAQTRRLRLDGRERIGVCVSQLAVLPEPGSLGSGALLLAKVLSGPQDLTWTDSGTDDVVRMWRTLKGEVDHARAVDFVFVVRPARWAGDVVRARLGPRAAPRRSALPVPAMPLQALGRRLLPAAFPPLPPEVHGTDAAVAEIVAALPSLDGKVRLGVDYDESGLEHQFGLIERLAPGPLVRRIVRLGDKVIGWYAYLWGRRSTARVLHLACRRPEVAGAVLGELIEHAGNAGVAAISGRVEPHLHAPLRERSVALGYGLQPLIHSRDPELLALLAGEASRLTELDSVDSQWWTLAPAA